MKSKITIIIIFLSFLLHAQQEVQRWDEKPDPYLPDKTAETSVKENNSSSVTSVMVNASISLYRFVISDQDGDNCPFHPSCSEFFVESVEQTNLLQGIAMFGDRFTRDMNIFNRRSKYLYIRKNRLYDPPELYTLNKNAVFPPK